MNMAMLISGLMEASLSSLSTSEVAPTEDSVTALLEVLVDPVLPLKLSGKDTPSLEQQLSVAKQVQSLYFTQPCLS